MRFPARPVEKGTDGTGRNFLHLLRGRGLAGLLSLAATALMARALAPDAFGLVVLIHTWLLAVRGLINLKPFEAIIRYGVQAQERGQVVHIRRLLRITLGLETVVTLLGTLVAVSVLPLLGPVFGWDDEAVFLAMVYSLLLLSSPTGTASGVLRLCNRFDLLGWRQALGPLVQLAGVSVAWWAGGGYPAFLAAMGLGWLAENLLMLVFGYGEYRRRLAGPCPGPIWAGHRQAFPGLWRFLHVVYWQSNLDMIPKRLAVLGVGALLGSAAGGLFRLAQQFAKVLSIPALLLRQVLFPDLARLWHRRDRDFPRRVRRILWTALGAGVAVALLTLLVGEPLIVAVVGADYLGALDVLFWLMLAAGMELGVAALRAAGYAMGLAGRLLRIYLLSLLVYGALFLGLGGPLGLAGVGLATAGWALVNLVLMGGLIRRRVRYIGDG